MGVKTLADLISLISKLPYIGGHKRTGTTSVQQTFRVKTLYKHKDFTMRNLRHDIAVLELDGKARLSQKVTTVCLPDQAANLNSKCYITGLTFKYIIVIHKLFYRQHVNYQHVFMSHKYIM